VLGPARCSGSRIECDHESELLSVKRLANRKATESVWRSVKLRQVALRYLLKSSIAMSASNGANFVFCDSTAAR
jgi:hypothetical protein